MIQDNATWRLARAVRAVDGEAGGDALHGAFILRILAHNGMDICKPTHTLARRPPLRGTPLRRRGEGPPRTEYQQITPLTLSAQGREQAAMAHVEQACRTWGRALGMLDGVRSARAADAVDGMRRTLRPLLQRGARVAGELDEQARTWQEAHACSSV